MISKEWGSEPLVESSECITRQVSRWLVEATKQLEVTPSVSESCFCIEMDELCGFVAKVVQMLDRGSDGFHVWQSIWLCLWQLVNQDRWKTFQVTERLAYDGLRYRIFENLRTFASHRIAQPRQNVDDPVELPDCCLRHYLARLQRKTLCYGKPKKML